MSEKKSGKPVVEQTEAEKNAEKRATIKAILSEHRDYDQKQVEADPRWSPTTWGHPGGRLIGSVRKELGIPTSSKRGGSAGKVTKEQMVMALQFATKNFKRATEAETIAATVGFLKTVQEVGSLDKMVNALEAWNECHSAFAEPVAA